MRRFIGSALIVAALTNSPGAGAQDGGPGAAPWRLLLCTPEPIEVAAKDPWLPAAGVANGRFATLLPGQPDASVMVGPCEKGHTQQCVARTGIVGCRVDGITRPLHATALMASAIAVAVTDGGAVARGSPLPAHLAMGLVEGEHGRKVPLERFARAVVERGYLTADQLRMARTLANRIASLDTQAAAAKATGQERRALAIYQGASRLLLAFILGHESFHVAGDRCPLERPSSVEAGGAYKDFNDLQVSGKVLCEPKGVAATPSRNELRADACALRFLEQETGALGEGTEATLSRRLSLDVAAWITAHGGLPAVVYEGDTKWRSHYTSDYLLPPLRTMAIQQAIALGERAAPAAVSICSETAQLLVTITQALGSQCKGEVSLPDSFVDRFPAGVRRGWETGRWDATSFSCGAPEPGAPR